MKFNIANPTKACQKKLETDRIETLRAFFNKRLSIDFSQKVRGEDLGEEFKGYVFKILGEAERKEFKDYVFKILGEPDKQGFPMKKGTLTVSGGEEESVADKKKGKRSQGSAEEPSRASNKSSGNEGNLQHTQPCSDSDQVAKVKQSVVDTLTSIRRLLAELETMEHKIEDSLQEINHLVN